MGVLFLKNSLPRFLNVCLYSLFQSFILLADSPYVNNFENGLKCEKKKKVHNLALYEMSKHNSQVLQFVYLIIDEKYLNTVLCVC